MEEKRIYTITENGFSMNGSGKVAIPACRVMATSYFEAVNKLNKFLDTQEQNPDVELITPLDKIEFKS